MSDIKPDIIANSSITGVVHPRGADSIQLKDHSWILSFTLILWRDAGGTVHHDDLLIRCEVTHTELKAYKDKIRPYNIISAKVAYLNEKSANLVKLIDNDVKTDEVLLQHVEQLIADDVSG